MSESSTGSMFSVGIGWTFTETETARYHTIPVSVQVRPLDWAIFSIQVPFTSVSGKETYYDQILVGGIPTLRETVLSYSNGGIGDLAISAWADCARLLGLVLGGGAGKAGETKAGPPGSAAGGGGAASAGSADPFAGVGRPMLLIGAGIKLPTGEHDARDADKYAFDRSKSLTGEYSESDGILPVGYELGSGTTDFQFGAAYQQRFWRFVLSGGIACQLSGGSNSVGYERSDIASLSIAVKFVPFSSAGELEASVRAGLSGIIALARDIDHSENTALLGRQERGPLSGSGRDYAFADIGAGVDFLGNFSFGLGARFQLNETSGSSASAFKYQFICTIGARF